METTSKKKHICVLATGGTIASRPTPNGLMPALSGEDILAMVPDLRARCDIDCVQLLQLDSTNLQPEHWIRMARAVAERRTQYDAFVITHGTDTMAYSAAALHYMLENIDRPVVLTGSQLPAGVPGTDAEQNLLTAFHAALGGHAGVYIAFGGRVMFGNDARKLCTMQLTAFGNINRPLAGRFAGGRLTWMAEPFAPTGAFCLHDQLDTRVGVLKITLPLKECLLVKDAPELKPRRGGGLAELLYGLRPQVIRENPELYLAFAAFCLFSVAVQVFFPYLIIYIQNYLGITDYAIVLGVVLLIASAVSVLSGRFIDRFGKLRFCFPAALVMLLGLLGMYFVRGMAGVMLAGTVMMSGYMLLSAALSATIRDWTPRGKVGHFQGIRMIFAVLLPMVIGPSLGAAVIRGSKSTYVELGQVKAVPTPGIYLAAAAVLLLTAIPVLILRKREKETRHS